MSDAPTSRGQVPAGESPAADRLRDPARVGALTDGVFAIVLTILVLEVAVPSNLSHDSLRRVLAELRPTLIAWMISFFIVGMYWVGHVTLAPSLGSGYG